MRPYQETSLFLIISSFFLALLLTIMPLPHWAIWLRPQWVLMVLLFWILQSSKQCGVITAWVIGILMDVVTGSSLGLHAFAFVAVSYGVLCFQTLIVLLSRWQQAGVIGMAAFLNGWMQGILFHWMGHGAPIGLYALSAVTTVIFWPWVFSWLDRLRPRALIR